MSDTPRTDEVAHRGYRANAYIAEMTCLARQLERELAAEQEIRLIAESTAVLAHDQSERERALADRLGTVLDEIAGALKENGWVLRPAITESLAAWKEARRDP